MKKYKIIQFRAIIKTIWINVIGSKYTLIITDTFLTILISIHTSKIDFESLGWKRRLFFYILLSILMNFIYLWADNSRKKKNKWMEYIAASYETHNKINKDTSTKLYRVNKKITEAIRSQNLQTGAINSIADFQTLSFEVCNELHRFITDYCECDNCEITIFQRIKDERKQDFVTMTAYRNSQNIQPATYGKRYYLSARNKLPLFTRIFKDVNADLKILNKKRDVQKEFTVFPESSSRENEICQYIGVPIRTNRNMIEILLQIDVSKKKALGNNYKSVKSFAENIVVPFGTLLQCSYERDLILSKFYDILEENISKKER